MMALALRSPMMKWPSGFLVFGEEICQTAPGRVCWDLFPPGGMSPYDVRLPSRVIQKSSMAWSERLRKVRVKGFPSGLEGGVAVLFEECHLRDGRAAREGRLRGAKFFGARARSSLSFSLCSFFLARLGPLKGIVLDLVKFFVAICVVDVAPVFCAESEAAGLTEMSDGGVRPEGFVVL